MSKLDEMKNSLDRIEERELAPECVSEKSEMMMELDKLKRTFECEVENAEKQRNQLIGKQETLTDAEQLVEALTVLIGKGNVLLSDAKADPSSYASTAELFEHPLKDAQMLIETASTKGIDLSQLNDMVRDAKCLHTQLVRRKDLWREFVIQRDMTLDQLEVIEGPLREITRKPVRPSNEVLLDLDELKMVQADVQELRQKAAELRCLSEELDPLESVYADVRFMDTDIEQTQQQLGDIMQLMDTELNEESVIMGSLQDMENDFHQLEDKVPSATNNEQLSNVNITLAIIIGCQLFHAQLA
ncbi:unnamed protein product [Anisakis simplex]|uniref:Nuclear anchorage protein 1 (inferred by orthology to a C. elegans protein) n=1 Tax=Anisakis simplex TaxID=6269 RepID=A0A0M3J770_ANISI|nr:unnamed protein product [Anisakis simplex]